MPAATPEFWIPAQEIEITATRSQGAGGQNVNKVASAIHLRFDIPASSLPEAHKARLLALNDQRITRAGVLIIKAQTQRSQELNRIEALLRLHELVASAARLPRQRTPTQPTRSSQRRRLENKARHSQVKRMRHIPCD